MTSWQRKRKADEVPTPTAVALSDYCRRAQQPASAAEVRDALSVLSDDEDFRVRELTDRDPGTKGLGPFAVIDVVRGTPEPLAKTRQSAGYYDVVRELLTVRDEKVIEVQVPTLVPMPAAPANVSAASVSKEPRGKKASEQSIAEKIAPKKREPVAATNAAETDDDKPLLPYQERQQTLPRPRGRFSRLDATKSKYEDLLRPAEKSALEAAIEQRQNRASLLRTLSESHAGFRGKPLSMRDLMEALETHRLIDLLLKHEREQVLSALREHRGALGRVSWALGITPAELSKLVKEAGLEREVDELRERFRRDALSPQHLTLRLDLLGREKYLADLGIKKRFTDSLEADLRKLFAESAEGAPSLNAAVEEVARKHGAPSELILRAIEKLGLGPRLEELLQRSPTQPEA